MLDIDAAIKHCEEVAEQNETQAEKWREEGGEEWGKTTACRECAAEHRQLAEWLRELKGLREEYANLNKISYGYYKELKEAKRFLKSATKVLNLYIPCDEDYNCTECIKQGQNCDYDDSFKWIYADEALKLLIGESNEP